MAVGSALIPGRTGTAAPPPPKGARTLGVVFVAVLVAVTLIAGFLRIWLAFHSALDADEAIVGLLAQGIRHGHFSAFYWGQHYGGVEPYSVAAMFGVFGQAPAVLVLTASVLALVTSLVVWRIGLRLFSPGAAMTAAVLAWIWPEVALWNSTREYGFHQIGVLLGMVVFLGALRIVDDPPPRPGGPRDWVLCGVAAGLGWWATPEVLYMALPAAYLLVAGLRGRRLVDIGPRVLLGAVAFVVGALPWIYVSVKTHFGTLVFVTEPVAHNTYGRRLTTFFSHVAPLMLGTRIEGAGAWEGPALFAIVSTLVVVALVIGAAVVLAVSVPKARFLVIFVVTFPFLYAAFPSNWFWNDGRYGIWLTPVLALVLCGALWHVVSERMARFIATCALILALASTLVAFNAGYGALSSPSRLTSWSANPNATIDDLASDLETHGVVDVYAGYWVAYELTYLSGGQVEVMALQNDRNPADDRVVEDAPSAGWLFVHPGRLDTLAEQLGTSQFLQSSTITEAQFESWLAAHHIPFHVTQVGDFDLVQPARNVRPSMLAT